MKHYITAGVTHDGFGARMQRCISVMCFVHYLQDTYNLPVEYLHTPFSYEEEKTFGIDYIAAVKERTTSGHPYNDVSHEGYMTRARKWDDKLLFKGKTIFDIDVNDFKIVQDFKIIAKYKDLLEDIKASKDIKKVYVLKYPHQLYDYGTVDMNVFEKYRNKILNSFDFDKTDLETSEIALHIRRQDIGEDSARYLEDDYYLDVLNKLKELNEIEFATVYTQREGFNASRYVDYNVVFDDQEEDYDTFMKLLKAKVLVVGSSSFSYVAGLLNPNRIVYHYQPFSHKALDSWISKEKYVSYLNSK